MAGKSKRKVATIDFRQVILKWLEKNGHSKYWLASKCVNQSADDAEIKKERYHDKSKQEWRYRNVPMTTKSRPLGMTPNSVYRYLRGERDITADKLAQILTLIGAKVDVD